MNKKFISSVLAGACALSMTSIAAFAADSTGAVTTGSDGIASQEVTVSATTQMPTLNVTVPTTATVIVNPYKLSVTTPITSSDTIISPEYEIKNESDCGITVAATAKVAAAQSSGVTIATKPLKGTETTKSVFMWLETTATSDTYYTTDIGTADAPNVVNTYVEKKVTAKKGETLTADQTAANAAFDAQMALASKETTKDIATLSAGNTTAQSIYFKLLGDVATAPKTPWVAGDKVDVTLTLKITPNANATTAAGGPVVSFTDPTGLTGALTAGTGVSNLVRTGDDTYTADLSKAALSGATAVTTAFTIPLDTGITVDAMAGVASDNATAVTASGTQLMVGGLASVGDTANLTIKLSNGTTVTVAATIVA